LVQLMSARRLFVGQRDESGAVAVLVASFAVLMFVLAALVVDMGLARDTRRQAQNGADAAALAGANVLYETGVANKAAAVEEIKEYALQNFDVAKTAWASCTDPELSSFPTFVRSSESECISFEPATNPKTVRVRIPGRDVDAQLGALAGDATMKVGAVAHAGVDVEPLVPEGGLRPWGICSRVATTNQGNVVFVPMKSGESATDPGGGCGTNVGPPGGWWVAQCTGQSNSNNATEAAVLNGCPTSTYAPVPNQPASATPAQLEAFLEAACPRSSETQNCLASDPGNNFHNSSDEWETLVGKTITMPVFCFPPQCVNPSFAAQGNNASYGIWRLATVEVCGMRLMPRGPSSNWPTTGACATNNPQGYTSSSVTRGGGLFLVIKKLVGGPPGTDWEMPRPPTQPRLVR
jgi:hypothetical protein